MRRIKVVISKKGKAYHYDRDRMVLVKNGKVHDKNVEKYIRQINRDKALTAAQKTTIINDLKAKVKEYTQDKRTLSNYGFEGHRSKNAIDRMFANSGRSTEDAAAEIGVTEDELRNPLNWDDGVFTAHNKKWVFKMSYTGDVLSEQAE